MKAILRSLTYRTPAEKTQAKENLGRTKAERFLNLTTAEKAILTYVLDHLTAHGEAPQFQLVHQHFEGINAVEETVLLDEIEAETFHDGTSYRRLLEDRIEHQAAQNLANTCKEAIKIATQGLSNGKGPPTKGTDQAIAHLFSSLRGTPKDNEGRMRASMRLNAQALETQYLDRKKNPQQTYGILTGYGLIDQATGGLRKKQLRIHAGFGGHLKSTQMFNEIVNAACMGWNPLLFTTEMPADDVQQLMIAIHSGDARFNGTGRPLNAFRLLLGALRDDEFDFYKTVKDDLLTNPQHGSIRVIDTAEFTTLGSVMQRTVREHAEEEVDLLWIDYLTRMPTDTKYQRLDITSARNETLADAKRFAMSFNDGQGLPVCTPFQVNREGYKRATENEGRLTLTALAQYNAAEKEADIISYIFYDKEERATSEPKEGLLKARYGRVPADPVPVYVDPDCRRIYDMSAGMGPATGYAPTAGGKDDEVAL